MGQDHIRYLTRQFYLKLLKNHFYLPKICLHNANGPFVFRKLRNTVSAVCLCSLVTKLGGAYLTKKMTLVEMTDAFWFQPSKLWHDFRPKIKFKLTSRICAAVSSSTMRFSAMFCFWENNFANNNWQENFLLHTGYFSLEFPGSSSIAVLEKLFCLQILRAEHYWFSKQPLILP